MVSAAESSNAVIASEEVKVEENKGDEEQKVEAVIANPASAEEELKQEAPVVVAVESHQEISAFEDGAPADNSVESEAQPDANGA